MAMLEVKNLSISFGGLRAVDSFNVNIEKGELYGLIGPNGAGKTTVFNLLTGVYKPDEGFIKLDGKDITDLEPGKRDVAMVFQNYAIYPTMTVRGNIEFGLKNRGVPKEERTRRILDVARSVGMVEYLDRKPSTLSGGQRQRIALARAMVKQPKVFLMDEPLSNLDAKLRVSMRTELIEMHRQLKTTFVYVTHDQVEAMSMADRIVLMDKGRIQQQASPETLYRDPENVFAAQFVGTPPMNILLMRNGKRLGFRPESVQLASKPSEDPFCRAGEIVTREMLGSETLYKLRMGTDTIMIKSGDDSYRMGDKLFALVPASKLFFFNEDGQRIRSGSGADMNALIRTVRGENLD